MRRYLWTLIAVIGGAIVWQTDAQNALTAQRGDAANRIAIDSDDIAGVVTSRAGPGSRSMGHRGNDSLPTKFRKIVVTDDDGRYLLPDLPRADYVLWVRGYGLVDSPQTATPGQPRCAAGRLAPDARAAAQIYPANYWYSLIRLPPEGDFPGHGSQGNGIESPDGDAAPLDQSDQDGLQRVPSAWQSCDARVSGGARYF